MKILHFYLGRATLTGILGALFVLIALDTFFSLLHELKSVGRGDYTWLAMMQYMAMTTPMRFYRLFPTAMLIGGLFGLGALAAHNEIVAMRSMGVSINRIVHSVLMSGLALTVVAVIIGEFVAPQSLATAQQFKLSRKAGKIDAHGHAGVWIKDGNRKISIQDILPGGQLGGITVYHFDATGELQEITTAARGTYDAAEENWIVEDISRSKISTQGGMSEQFASQRWKYLLAPDLLNTLMVVPEQLSAWDLLRYIEYLKQNHLQYKIFALAFWARISTPLSGLVMLLLALPFVFSMQREGNAGKKLFIGMMIGLVFYIFNRMVGNLSVAVGISPIIGAFLPVTVFFALGLYALRWVNSPHN